MAGWQIWIIVGIAFFILARIFSKREYIIGKIIFTIIIVHFMFSGMLHSSAIYFAGQNGFEHASALPDSINPFRWRVIGSNETHYRLASLDLQHKALTEEYVFSKEYLPLASETAKTDPELSAFLSFARFPYAGSGNGTLSVTDLRFGGSPGKGHFRYETSLQPD